MKPISKKRRVQVLRYAVEGDKGPTGLSRYYDRVMSALQDADADVETIDFGPPDLKGIRYIIKEMFLNPLIQTIRGRGRVDVYHATYEMLGLFFPFTKAKRIVTVHHIVGKDEGNGRLWRAFWDISARISIFFADEIIAISSSTRDKAVSKYRIPQEKISVVTHPQDPIFRVLDIEKKKILGSMGALLPRKNHQSAIRVFERISKIPGNEDYTMVIVGKGPQLDDLKKLAFDLGISDKVSFKSDVSMERLVEFYNTCSVILNTSSKEGLGLATLEAQACGTPVVFFKDADIPPEVMEAAVPCAGEEDMARVVAKILGNLEYMERLIGEGLDFSNKNREFKRKMTEIYFSSD